MTVTSADSGTQAATISSEHTLSTQTTVGVYVLVVDCNAMVLGDTLELRLKTKAKSGSTSRQSRIWTLANVQEDANFYSDPIAIDTEIVATLKQTAGTGRSFDWNLLRV